MPDHQSLHDISRSLRLSRAAERIALLRISPAKLLLIGYSSYILLGWILLSLPVSQAVPVGALDNLFIATSAVSTTGLVSVDPGSSYTFLGEVVIMGLIQIGGLGYMTLGSFVVLSLTNGLSSARTKATRNVFNLPESISPRSFILAVVIFTFLCEAIGAALLYPMFVAEGVEAPLWSAIFHSVSAFCTAGFSLNATSFEAFRGHVGINVTIAALSILGAMGFLIVVDGWRTVTGKASHLGFSSKVIARITFAFLAGGTVLFFVIEPSIQDLEPSERLLAAFFQVMTASATVGFNTHPISALSSAVLIVLFFLMIVGASPAGTGGGLKTTSFAALVALVRSTLKGRDRVRFFKREIPPGRLQNATASVSYYAVVAMVAAFLLFLTEPQGAFDVVLFEVLSAMGTVGLSMGLTGELSDLGKVIVIILMTAGRIGILTFGIAISAHDESREEESDNELVL
ncbi:K+ transporter Trk [Jannaschia pagri]|uniref:K+ transporter Trk n=1 Tax=Jannaschia pagri TaxID=2829797 RepID=A0ABQ4NHG5_9RHOB|nr:MULTISPECIES: potassium transporter TrkG [unclassified Jannaschia]GIT90372.1 K+ transporter Trk [Jannaschia sp. AI_61]GIT93522.1 K+ transporter Trk [Jannaschia sp. AI_62]